MATKVKVSSYLKNVGRSFGYAVGDVVGDYAPTVKSIISDTKSTVKDAKLAFNDFKNNSVSDYTKSFSEGSNIFSNTLDDLKTGNWYNKQREEDAMNSMFGFDFDMDDFGSEDWGDDDSTEAMIESDANNTREVIGAMDSMSTTISKSIGYSSAKSAEYIVANSNASTRALYDLNKSGFSNISNILLNMNNTLTGIAELGSSVSTHVQNSAVFYTQTTETLHSMSENLALIAKRTEYLEKTYSKDAPTNRRGLDRFYSDGNFNAGEYFDMVKENVKEQTDMIKGLADMLGMTVGKRGENTSLAQMALKGGISALIPNFAKETVKQFNESLANAVTSGLMRGGARARNSSNPLFNILGDIFFPKNELKTNFNSSNYEKGPLPWDGIARKTLVEVIPTYLAKITAAITGDKNERYFDAESGKFVTMGNIRNRVNSQKESMARNAGGQFREEARNRANGNSDIEDALDRYFLKAFEKGEGFYNISKKKNDKKFLDEFGLTPEAANILASIIEDAKKPNSKYKNMAGNFESAVYSGRAQFSDYMRRQESSGSSALSYAYNGWDDISANKAVRNDKGDYVISGVTLTQKEYDKFVALLGDPKKEKDFLDKKKKEEIKKSTAKSIEDNLGTIGKGFKGKVEDVKSRNIFQKIKYYWEEPFAAVSEAVNSLTNGINRLFWGENGDDGIIDKIGKKINNITSKLKEKLNEFFNGKNRKKNAAKANGLPEGTADVLFKELPNGRTIYYAIDEEGNKLGTVDEADAIDFYNKTSLKSAMKKEWQNIKNSAKNWFFGAEAKANQVGNAANAFHQRYSDIVAENGSYSEYATKNAGSGSGLLAGGSSRSTKRKRKAAEAAAAAAEAENAKKEPTTPSEAIEQGAKDIGKGIKYFLDKVIYGEEKDPDKEKKEIFDRLKGTMGDLGMAKGAMGIGALTGVGVSVLTGALVGPIAGAAIGAGVGLAAKSKQFQSFLFGEGDPGTDEYKKGLTGAFGDALRKSGFKEAKGVGIGGGVGLVGGFLMGSPVLGAIVGSTVGYVATSDKAKKALFGDIDEEGNRTGGVFSKELQQKIKKAAPNIAAGVGAGLLLGPFGVAGNLIVGAGMGYLTTTEKFHNFMFGNPDDEDDKGFAGLLHDKIINPIDEITHNMVNLTKGLFRKVGTDIAEKIKDGGKKLFGLVGKLTTKLFGDAEHRTFLGKAVDKVGNVVKAPVNLAGKVLNGIDTGTKRLNLSMGNDVYNRQLGRNMTAAERIDQRNLIKNKGAEAVVEDGETVYYKLDANGNRIKKISKRQYEKIAKKQDSFSDTSKYGKVDTMLAGMNQEDIAKLGEMNDADLEAKLKDLGIKKVTKGDLKQVRNLAKTENDTRFDIDKLQKKSLANEEDFRVNLLGIVHNLDYKISGGRAFGLVGAYKTKVVAAASKDDIKNAVNPKGKKKKKKYKYQMDPFGNIHKQEETPDGELKEVNNDKETDNARKQINQLQSDIHNTSEGMTKMGSWFGSFGKIFGGEDDEEDDEEDEEHESIFSKIFNFLGGGGLSSILSTVLTTVIPIALVGAGITGKLDNIAAIATGGQLDDNTSTTVTLSDGSMAEVTQDADGNYVDANGNVIDSSQITNVQNVGSNTSLTKQLLKNAFWKGGNSVIGKVLTKPVKNIIKAGKGAVNLGKNAVSVGKNAVGKVTSVASKIKESGTKLFSKFAKNNADDAAKASTTAAAKVLDTAEDAVATSAKSGLSEKIVEAIKNFPDVFGKIPGIKNSKMATTAQKWIPEFSKHIDDAVNALKGADAKVLLGKMSKVIWVVQIATAVAKGIDAFTGQAASILGITTKPTFSEKCIATLITVVNCMIPVIGGLIPDKTLVNIFMKLAKTFKWDEGDGSIAKLAAKREAAEEEVEKYNSENGTDYSIEEYNELTLTDENGNVTKKSNAGIVTKGVNAIKSLFSRKKNKSSSGTTSEASTTGQGSGLAGGASALGTMGNLANTGMDLWSKYTIAGQITTATKDALSKYTAINDASDIMDRVKTQLVNAGYIDVDTDLSDILKDVVDENGNISITRIAKTVASKIGSTVKKKFSSIASKVSSVTSKIKGFFTGSTDTSTDTSGEGSGLLAGGSSGFISQLDPRYNNYNIAGNSFASKGCGPAVAAMTASALGKNMSVGQAVRASNGYQTANGVTLDYFQKALGAEGIDTQYIAGGGAADLYSSIAHGNKVVLLGQDAMNTSKEYSPFGPNNHYVVATGLDRRGNVIVNDPENNGPRAYNPAILNSAKYGIAASGSGLHRIAAGSSVDVSKVKSQVWHYLKKNGFSEQAAAGIMGNLQQETDFNYLTKTGVTEGIACWDKQGSTWPLEAAAKKAGKNWQDLSFQLSHLVSSLSSALNNYSGKSKVYYYSTGEWCCWTKKVTIDQFKALTSINEATEIFERCYERASKPMMENRKKYANAIYKEFTGKEGEAIDSSSYSTDSSSSSSSGTTFSTALQAMSGISTIFSDAFNSIFGTSSSSSDDSSSDSSTGSSGSVDSADTSEQSGGKHKTYPTGKGTAASAVEIARSQLGVVEGSNDATDYGSFTGANNAPWCASFVSWVMDKAFNGDKNKTKKALRGGTSASVQTFYDNFRKAKAFDSNPKQGDLVIYKNGSSHVGLVEAVDSDGKIHTIEGNTSGGSGYSRNGGMVARKEFYKRERNNLSGFGHPDWSGAAAAGSGILDYSTLARNAGGSAGTLIGSRVGSRNNTAFIRTKSGALVPVHISGGASDITTATQSMLANVQNSASSNKSISPELVAQLLTSITKILNNIATNTAPVNQIYSALTAYMQAGGSSGVKDNVKVVKRDPVIKESASTSTDVDENFSALVGVLAELAKG